MSRFQEKVWAEYASLGLREWFRSLPQGKLFVAAWTECSGLSAWQFWVEYPWRFGLIGTVGDWSGNFPGRGFINVCLVNLLFHLILFHLMEMFWVRLS